MGNVGKDKVLIYSPVSPKLVTIGICNQIQLTSECFTQLQASFEPVILHNCLLSSLDYSIIGFIFILYSWRQIFIMQPLLAQNPPTQTRLESNSQGSPCLCLPNAVIKGVCQFLFSAQFLRYFLLIPASFPKTKQNFGLLLQAPSIFPNLVFLLFFKSATHPLNFYLLLCISISYLKSDYNLCIPCPQHSIKQCSYLKEQYLEYLFL